ncbi:MAG: methionyl-tRNA formyltransferase [Patescibacteria group bacterium]
MKNDPIKLRTIFMGTSSFSRIILEGLIKANYNIISVYTQPDKKTGREQEISESSVKLFAEKNHLAVKQIECFDQDSILDLQNQKPDLIIVVAYGKILPQEVLAIPGFGALNIHASLLPKFRGPSPIQNAILSGEKEIGTTIMLMDKGIDSGDIIAQDKLRIEPEELLPEIMDKLAFLSSELLLKTLPLWIDRKITPKKQDPSQATFCQLIERSDGRIFWNEEARSIFNRFRAFHPWPGIFTFWEDESGTLRRIKLNKIGLSENEAPSDIHVGQVFQDQGDISVKTSRGTILLKTVQIEGKKPSEISEFLNGYGKFLGSVLK